jgi:hypothetical protein
MYNAQRIGVPLEKICEPLLANEWSGLGTCSGKGII